MELARIELRWLDALPLHRQLLLGEVLPHYPLDLLIRQAQQFGDDAQGNDGFGI